MPEISVRGLEMPESPIRKLAPLAAAAKKRGTKVYHLNIGQPDLPTPQVALDALRPLRRGHPGRWGDRRGARPGTAGRGRALVRGPAHDFSRPGRGPAGGGGAGAGRARRAGAVPCNVPAQPDPNGELWSLNGITELPPIKAKGLAAFCSP